MIWFSTVSIALSAFAALVALYSLGRSTAAIREANTPSQVLQLRKLVSEYSDALDEAYKKNQAQLARYAKYEKALERVQAPQAAPRGPELVNGADTPMGGDMEAQKAQLRAMAVSMGLRG